MLLAVSIFLVMITESYHYHMRKDVLFNISIEKLLILTKIMRNIEKVKIQLYLSRFEEVEADKKLLNAIKNSNKLVIKDRFNKLIPFFISSTPTLEHIHLYDKNAHFIYSSDKVDESEHHFKSEHEDENSVLLHTLRTKSFSKGYVITKNDGFYQSLISPLFENKAIVGYLEFGLKADSLFKLSSKAGRYKYALYLNKNTNQIKREIGKLVASNSKIFKKLQITQDFINQNANKNNVISYNNKYYLFQQYDIESSFQKDFAQVVMANDVTNYVEDNFNKASYMVSVSLLILLIIMILVYIVFTKLINKLTKEEEELLTKQTQIQIIMDNSNSLIALLEGENLTLANKPFLTFLSCSDMRIFLRTHNNLNKLFIDVSDTFSMPEAVKNSDWILEINKLEESKRVVTLKHPYFGLNYFSVKVTKIPEHPDSKIVIFSDITSIFEKSKKDEYMAYHDNLTNIYNRQYFNESISKTIHDLQKNKISACLLMLDLDFFKKVNDTYGHQVGDDVLVQFSKSISDNIRANDIFARWGGEEFVILLNYTDEKTAYKVAQTLREKIAHINFKEAGQITCSIGLSQFQENDSADAWLSRVDRALYEAKENGRNRVEVI